MRQKGTKLMASGKMQIEEIAEKMAKLEQHQIMATQSLRMLESRQKKISEQIDEATKRILNKVGVSEDQIKMFAHFLKRDSELINMVQNIQKDNEGFKQNFDLLKPELEKAFARKFDSREAKTIKAICKITLNFLPLDIISDQVDWKI